MPVDDELRDRVVFLGGKATGVECPDCGTRSRDVDLASHNVSEVSCPECGATVLTADEFSQLRQAGKL